MVLYHSHLLISATHQLHIRHMVELLQGMAAFFYLVIHPPPYIICQLRHHYTVPYLVVLVHVPVHLVIHKLPIHLPTEVLQHQDFLVEVVVSIDILLKERQECQIFQH